MTFPVIIPIILWCLTTTTTTTITADQQQPPPHPCCSSPSATATTAAIQVGPNVFTCPKPGSSLWLGIDGRTCACSIQQTCNVTTTNQTGGEGFTFTCPSGRILPLSKVNDEYCDCGTDEPNTSACAGQNHASKFLCGDRDETTVLMSFSHVHDTIPDCCDCRDESLLSSHLTTTTCDPTSCSKLAESLREARERKTSILVAGLLRKSDIVTTTAMKLTTMRNNLEEAKGMLEKDTNELKIIESQKNEIESKMKAEREELTSIQGALYKALNLTAQELADVTAAIVVSEGEQVIQDLVTAVTTATGTTTEATLAKDVCPTAELPTGRPDLVVTKLDLVNYVRVVWRFISDRFPRKLVELSKKQGQGQIDMWVKELEDGESSPKYSGMLTQYGEQITKLQTSKQTLQTKIDTLTTQVKLDYGTNATLIHLLDQDLSLKSGEFTYTVNFFDSIKQHTTLIGKYESWHLVQDADKETPQELKEGDDIPPPTIKFIFSQGEKCWSGPIRNGIVFARCGKNDELIKVVEPEMCKYVILMTTPVACMEGSGITAAEMAAGSTSTSIWERAKKSLFGQR